jgi:hypothetical protein
VGTQDCQSQNENGDDHANENLVRKLAQPMSTLLKKACIHSQIFKLGKYEFHDNFVQIHFIAELPWPSHAEHCDLAESHPQSVYNKTIPILKS